MDVEIPEDAGRGVPFDPWDDWIEDAPRELQVAAMRAWFLGRYENPANQTPYSSDEGDYVFVNGGPYDPADVVQARFGDVVEFEVMDGLIKDLWSEVGTKWAPIEHEGFDYDEALSMQVVDRTDPMRMLSDRLSQIEGVLTLTGNVQSFQLAIQLAHGAAITALEAYLWDTVSYWVANDEKTLRTMVATNKDFQSQTLPLSAIFDRLEGMKHEVDSYLKDLVWHRLDKVKPLIFNGMDVVVPDIGNLMKEVLIRHDIVHRGGRTKDGEPIVLSSNDVRRAVNEVRAFSESLEEGLQRRYQADEYWDDDIPF